MDVDRREPPIQFRAGEIEPELANRAASGQPLNHIARRDLVRYYALLKRSLPAFTAVEASLIVDACNGWFLEPHSAPLLWAQVDDAIRLEGLAEKWGVDGPALVARLRALTPFEALAVCDAAERFWAGPYREAEIGAALRAVGLVRERVS